MCALWPLRFTIPLAKAAASVYTIMSDHGRHRHPHAPGRSNGHGLPRAFDEDDDDGRAGPSSHYHKPSSHRDHSFHRNGGGSSSRHARDADGEEITGFGSSGAELLHAKAAPKAPIVIASLPDVDFREIARERRRGVGTAKDWKQELGSLTSMRRDGKGPVVPPADSELHRQGGTTHERINDGEQRRGLVARRQEEQLPEAADPTSQEQDAQPIPQAASDAARPPPIPETADEAARRALLASLDPNDPAHRGQRGLNDGLVIAATADDEEAILRRDTAERPEAPDLEAYAAIPVEGFGAAMLRGMGWSEGMGAGRKRDGPTNASQAGKRPALLGLGAKERKPPGPGGAGEGAGAGTSRKPNSQGGSKPRSAAEMKYMPLVRREREAAEGTGSSTSSRGGSTASSREGSAALSSSGERRERERPREEERQRHHRSSHYADDRERERRPHRTEDSRRERDDYHRSSLRDHGDRDRERHSGSGRYDEHRRRERDDYHSRDRDRDRDRDRRRELSPRR